MGFFCTIFCLVYFTVTSPFLLPKIPKEDSSKVRQPCPAQSSH